jgi:hypothetical protein
MTNIKTNDINTAKNGYAGKTLQNDFPTRGKKVWHGSTNLCRRRRRRGCFDDGSSSSSDDDNVDCGLLALLLSSCVVDDDVWDNNGPKK